MVTSRKPSSFNHLGAFVLIASLVAAQSTPVFHAHGRLVSRGKPIAAASFFTESLLSAKLEPGGTFDITSKSRGRIDLRAKGFAPLHVESAEDLGELELSPLKTAHLSIKVGAAATEAQSVALTDGACANLRSHDAKRCRFNLCLEQLGERLTVHLRESSGPFRLAAEAQSPPVLEPTQTWLSDAACPASVHVDSITLED